MFITIEGGEGTGKSTLLGDLKQYFRQAKRDVVALREPGGTPQGDFLRLVLTSGVASQLDPNLDLVIAYLSRRHNLERNIRPALAKGSIVLCDRFNDSSYAYQVSLGNASLTLYKALDQAIVADTQPDLTLLLDADFEITKQRLAARNCDETPANQQRFDNKNIEWHQRLRRTFQDLHRQNPERIKVIDASQSSNHTFLQARDEIANIMS